MTKIELHYNLTRKLDDEKLMEAVSRAHGVYGIYKVALSPSLDSLRVEYDASRLTPEEVEDWLRRLGLPVVSATATAG